VVVGLSRLSDLTKCRGVHLGGGGCTIAKFLLYKYPHISQIIIEESKSVIVNGSKYFNWPQKDKSFEVLNVEAVKFVY